MPVHLTGTNDGDTVDAVNGAFDAGDEVEVVAKVEVDEVVRDG